MLGLQGILTNLYQHYLTPILETQVLLPKALSFSLNLSCTCFQKLDGICSLLKCAEGKLERTGQKGIYHFKGLQGFNENITICS